MTEATTEELKESIIELKSYRDRIRKEIANSGKKLNIPSQKINLILKANSELNQINAILNQLESQLTELSKD